MKVTLAFLNLKPGNDIYYSSDKQNTPPNKKYKFKKKFKRKVMLYIFVSDKGISQPYLVVE